MFKLIGFNLSILWKKYPSIIGVQEGTDDDIMKKSLYLYNHFQHGNTFIKMDFVKIHN